MVSIPKPVKVKRKKYKHRTPKQKLFDKAEKLWSLYIRHRDGKCVTCGSTQNLTNGHLITRGKRSIFFDPKNCNCQCTSCNCKHEYYPEVYTAWFVNKHGVMEYNDLIRRGNELKKWSEDELLTIIRMCELTGD